MSALLDCGLNMQARLGILTHSSNQMDEIGNSKYKDEPHFLLCLNIRTTSQAVSPVSYRNLAGIHFRRNDR